jgi:hypothetical protein
MMKFKLTPVGLGLGLAAAIALSVPAHAAVPSPKACQSWISGKAKALEGQILGAYVACSNKMRANATNITAAATLCEKKLSLVYKGGGFVDKFRGFIESKTSATPGAATFKCDGPSLIALGFLLSGPGQPAPPATLGVGDSIATFTEDFLILKAEQDAWTEMLAQAPLFENQLQQLQIAVECSLGPSAYVNLCKVKSECMERACNLGSGTDSVTITESKQVFQSGHALTANLTGANIMDMCTTDGATLNTSSPLDPDVMYITGNQGRTLEIVNLGGGLAYVCVDTLRTAGFCDCSSLGGKGHKDISQCMDRDIYVNCPKGPLDTGTDACGAPCSAGQADPNYPPAYNGLPWITATTATTNGDCVQQTTNQFTVITGSQVGPDNAPCTADDSGNVNSPTTTVLTTGRSKSEEWNPVAYGGYGTCPTSGNPCVGACKNLCVSKHCTETDVACKGSGNGNCAQNVCTGVTYDTSPWRTLACGPADSSKPGMPCATNADCGDTACARGNWLIGKKPTNGIGIHNVGSNLCSLYLQNHLDGMRLVGSFPGSASADSAGLGDTLSSFNQDCK